MIMADKDKLLAYPMLEELVYRSNIDSKQLNSMLKSIDESVLRALIRGTELSEKINRLSLGVTSAYRALESHNQIYNSYPKSLTIPSGEYGGVAYATAFEDAQGGRQHKTGGIVTMNWENRNKTSKIPIYDGVINPSVQMLLDDVPRASTNPIYNCLDGDNSTFWVEAASVGTHTVELQLPPSISKKFNYLEIVPFPVFGTEITEVIYEDLQSIEHTIYPHIDNPFYNKTGPLIFHLTPKEWNNTLKIKVKVKDGINTIGFSKIDVGSIDYLDTSATIIMPFENIPQIDHTGSSLTRINPYSIDLDFYIDGVIEEDYDSFITEIALMDRSDGSNETVRLKKTKGPQLIETTSINVSQISGDNALYLKVVINESRLTSPVFRGAKLEWREVS